MTLLTLSPLLLVGVVVSLALASKAPASGNLTTGAPVPLHNVDYQPFRFPASLSSSSKLQSGSSGSSSSTRRPSIRAPNSISPSYVMNPSQTTQVLQGSTELFLSSSQPSPVHKPVQQPISASPTRDYKVGVLPTKSPSVRPTEESTMLSSTIARQPTNFRSKLPISCQPSKLPIPLSHRPSRTKPTTMPTISPTPTLTEVPSVFLQPSFHPFRRNPPYLPKTAYPTIGPTAAVAPTSSVTESPSLSPTEEPTLLPSTLPTHPTKFPTKPPLASQPASSPPNTITSSFKPQNVIGSFSNLPTSLLIPTFHPMKPNPPNLPRTVLPTTGPTVARVPTALLTESPSLSPTEEPTLFPSPLTTHPTKFPSKPPLTIKPTRSPSKKPSPRPTSRPTKLPLSTLSPVQVPTRVFSPSFQPIPSNKHPQYSRTSFPTRSPTGIPMYLQVSKSPSRKPTAHHSSSLIPSSKAKPTAHPTSRRSIAPTRRPSNRPQSDGLAT